MGDTLFITPLTHTLFNTHLLQLLRSLCSSVLDIVSVFIQRHHHKRNTKPRRVDPGQLKPGRFDLVYCKRWLCVVLPRSMNMKYSISINIIQLVGIYSKVLTWMWKLTYDYSQLALHMIFFLERLALNINNTMWHSTCMHKHMTYINIKISDVIMGSRGFGSSSSSTNSQVSRKKPGSVSEYCV